MSPNNISEGIKIQEVEGSGKLQTLLTKLKTHSFNGYIMVEIPDKYEGLVIIKKGIPRASQLDTPSGKLTGLESLQNIQALDQSPKLKISIHTKVDVDKLISELEGEIPGKEKEIVSEEYSEEEDKKSLDIMGKEIIDETKQMSKDIEDEFPNRYSFENFIVGPNNRFAYAAAVAVSKSPDRSYNPLFIKGESGLGKTHLMKAIGRALSKRFSDRQIKYITTSKLVTDFKKYLEQDELADFREKYSEFDTLLLDDIQFITEKPEAQHSLFHILNEIQDGSGQIVISSDRPPEQITEIEERLASRFKSGLVVDILPPTYESRKEIIKEKSKQFSIDTPPDVMNFIAKNIKKNVRFIEGALTRISAYSDLLDEKATLDNVRKTLEQYIDKEVETRELKLDVLESRSYLIKEQSADIVFELFEKIEKDLHKFIISRLNPKRIEEEFDLEEAEVKWLTDKESEIYDTISPNLERLSWVLEKKIKEDSLILLDGLEYLISNVNFEASLKFIRHMVDIVSETKSIFLVIVNPNALDEKQISILEREMDTISYVS
ncbi:MAG: DnaA ATPase domain-containing protein [Thermoplasmatota archaeon]